MFCNMFLVRNDEGVPKNVILIHPHLKFEFLFESFFFEIL